MHPYHPEGQNAVTPTADELRHGAETGRIFQAMCCKCDEFHNLHLDLGPIRGVIPREEAALGIRDGSVKEIAILSRVGKWVSFQVLAFDLRGNVIGSRRAAQAEAGSYFLNALSPGDVVPAMVQNPSELGAFCDIGCGFTGLMRIDRCCVSRLTTTAELFTAGQSICAAILRVDDTSRRIELTGRELLGTWEENAACFRPGQTVIGTVRSIMPYGVFIELTPNLSGLSEPDPRLAIGDRVSVHIRSIQEQKHKIKLAVIEALPPTPPPPPDYFIRSGHIDRWEYWPGSKAVTFF